MKDQKNIVILGAGAAGFFAAIHAAARNPEALVILIEKSNKILSKVKISGGGRCNVTHACIDNRLLSSNYPRGQKELLQAFSQFSPKDTIEWFESRNVPLKIEKDGRMFPKSDTSQSIIDCLVDEANKHRVKVWMQFRIKRITKNNGGFCLYSENEKELLCDKLIVATGGSAQLKDYEWLKELGHNIVAPVPSLFTFNVPNSKVTELQGISVEKVKISISGTKLSQQGPVLITHWGFSGPAILKLSAWGAMQLHELNYNFEFRLNWMPDISNSEIAEELLDFKINRPKQKVHNKPLFDLPGRLWNYLISKAEISEKLNWADLSKKKLNRLAELLSNDCYTAQGKTTFKEEFVTCGGINLNDIDMKTMQSKQCEGLFFAGEVINVDGITGGFNFQAAWTTGYIAGRNV